MAFFTKDSTAGRILAVLLGQVLPLLGSLLAFPLLYQGLGSDRFGYFMLAWTIAGYVGVLDLGVSRALTRLVAGRRYADLKELASLFWASQAVVMGASAALAVLLAVVSPTIAGWVTTESDLRSEVIGAFRILAISIPFMAATSALRGFIEGYERFDIIAAIRAPTGLMSAFLPIAVLQLTNRLEALTGSLVGVRILTHIILLLACVGIQPTLRRIRIRVPRGLTELLTYGGWVSVSNIVGPIIVYMDRFLLGSLAGVAAVSYYVAPFEAQTRLLILATSLTTVLFPAIAASSSRGEPRSGDLLRTGNRASIGLLFPISLALTALAPEALGIWMGSDFATQAIDAWRWLAVGVFLNGLAQSPFAYMQAIGRPRSTAVLHLTEIVPYLLLLYVLVPSYGAEGAAAAWALRAGVDCVALWILAYSHARKGAISDALAGGLATGALLLFLGDFSFTVRAVVLATLLVVYVPVAWTWVLTVGQRDVIRRALRGA
jgi:O-antigen/teichoic acid export membrane protein